MASEHDRSNSRLSERLENLSSDERLKILLNIREAYCKPDDAYRDSSLRLTICAHVHVNKGGTWGYLADVLSGFIDNILNEIPIINEVANAKNAKDSIDPIKISRFIGYNLNISDELRFYLSLLFYEYPRELRCRHRIIFDNAKKICDIKSDIESIIDRGSIPILDVISQIDKSPIQLAATLVSHLLNVPNISSPEISDLLIGTNKTKNYFVCYRYSVDYLGEDKEKRSGIVKSFLYVSEPTNEIDMYHFTHVYKNKSGKERFTRGIMLKLIKSVYIIGSTIDKGTATAKGFKSMSFPLIDGGQEMPGGVKYGVYLSNDHVYRPVVGRIAIIETNATTHEDVGIGLIEGNIEDDIIASSVLKQKDRTQIKRILESIRNNVFNDGRAAMGVKRS